MLLGCFLLTDLQRRDLTAHWRRGVPVWSFQTEETFKLLKVCPQQLNSPAELHGHTLIKPICCWTPFLPCEDTLSHSRQPSLFTFSYLLFTKHTVIVLGGDFSMPSFEPNVSSLRCFSDKWGTSSWDPPQMFTEPWWSESMMVAHGLRAHYGKPSSLFIVCYEVMRCTFLYKVIFWLPNL